MQQNSRPHRTLFSPYSKAPFLTRSPHRLFHIEISYLPPKPGEISCASFEKSLTALLMSSVHRSGDFRPIVKASSSLKLSNSFQNSRKYVAWRTPSRQRASDAHYKLMARLYKEAFAKFSGGECSHDIFRQKSGMALVTGTACFREMPTAPSVSSWHRLGLHNKCMLCIASSPAARPE